VERPRPTGGDAPDEAPLIQLFICEAAALPADAAPAPRPEGKERSLFVPPEDLETGARPADQAPQGGL
jgi:hypothetical protein